MKLLMKKYAGVSVEASTSRAITTFIIKGKAEEDVAKAKRELLSRLSKKVTIEVQVPAGMRAFIIGAKGESLSSPPRPTLTARYDQVATSSRSLIPPELKSKSLPATPTSPSNPTQTPTEPSSPSPSRETPLLSGLPVP